VIEEIVPDSTRDLAENKSAATPWILLSITLITLAIISRVGMIAWPFLNDSGLYAAMGRTVATGGVLYRDFYETKLPGAGLLAAAFWAAFGHHWAGYVLCQLMMAIIAATALWRITRSVSTFLFAMVFLNLSQAVYTGFQLETIQAFFEAFAALAAWKSLRDDSSPAAFAAGIFAGLAAMAKPGGLGIAIAFGLTLLIHRRRLIQIVALVGGVAIPTAATLVYTVRSGAWPYLPGVLVDIQHYATGTPVDFGSIVKVLVVLLVLGFPFVFRLIGPKASIGGTPMILMWFAADLAAALMQRRLYPYHFLPLACPAAVMYGLLPRRATPLSIALGLLPIALFSLTWEGSSISQLHRGFERMPVSDYIVSHTSSTDTVFTDQIGRLLIETDRQPGSRLGTFFYLVNDDDAPHRYCTILLTDFESRKPEYLVLSPGWDQPVPGLANCDILQHCPRRRENFIAAWAVLREYVAVHYHQEVKIDGRLLYRRNAATGGPTSPIGSLDRSPSALQAGAGESSR
jgi:hypothetical protein